LPLDKLSLALSKQYAVPAAQQKDFEAVKPTTVALLPVKFVEKHSAIPLEVSDRTPKTISIAFLDPSKVEAIDEISFVTGMRVRPMVAPELQIFFHMEKLYGIRRR